jgi:hypothetical protein
MPDGDEVRDHLEGKYRSAYKRLCEGKTSDDDLADSVVEPTIKKLQDYGDEALQLVNAITFVYEKVHADLPLFKDQIDWPAVRKQTEKIAQETCMDKRAKHLVLQANQNLAEQLRNGKVSSSLATDMLDYYVQRIYRVDFEAYVESGLDHMYNASLDKVKNTLTHMKLKVAHHLSSLAKQAYQQGTVQNLKLPSRATNRNKQQVLTS